MSRRLKYEQELETEIEIPKMFAVIIHNDDYTTMEFVVELLMRVFSKKAEEASSLMMFVHETGSAVVDHYPYDIAVSKKMLADQMAFERGFPLKITISEQM